MNAVVNILDKPLSSVRKVEPEPFAAFNISEAEPEPRDEIIQGMIAAGDVVALVGTPGTGKTSLAVHMAACITSGSVFFGKLVRGGPVIYFAAEAPTSVITRSQLSKGKVSPEKRLPFYVVKDAPLLGDPTWSAIHEARIIATINAKATDEGEPIRLVIMDTLASCLGVGDENGDGMIALTNAARRIANQTMVAVMVVHHPSKSDVGGLRGHGSLQGACDLIITTSTDDMSKVRTAAVVKSRHGESGLELAYKLEPVQLETVDAFGCNQTSIILEPVTDFKQATRRPKGQSQQRLLDELERQFRTGKTGWSEADIRKAALDIGLHRNSATRASSSLRISGYLSGSDAHLTLRYPPEK